MRHLVACRIAPVLLALVGPLATPPAGAQPSPHAAAFSAVPVLRTALRAPRRTTGAARLDATVVVVPLTTPGSRPIVTAWINGRGPFSLGIETGSSTALLLFSHATRALGLESQGVAAARAPVVDSVRIGGLLFVELPIQRFGDSPIPSQLDGMLGLAAFATVTMELDMPGRRALFTADTLPESNGRDILPLLTAGNLFAVAARMGDRPLRLTLDSQCGVGLSLRSTAAEGLPLLSPFVQVGLVTGPWIGTAPRHTGRAAGSMSIGRYEFERPLIATGFVPDQLPADGIMGMPALSAFSVAIDQRTKRVRFTRPEPVITAPGPLRSHGLAIAFGAERPLIAQVLPNSPAAAAELQVGDTIVEIDGRSTAGLTQSDWQPLSESSAALVLGIRRDQRQLTVRVASQVLVP